MSIVEKETGDTRARPVTDYGTYNGKPKPIAVDVDGNLKATIDKFGDDISENSNTSLRNTLVDGSNNIIGSSSNADGEYHLSTAIIQKIIESSNNSTSTNLASGATFTGAAEETFGISCIQSIHSADQDCTIYIDQSTDNTFPAVKTITDSYSCLANEPCSRIFVSVAPYYRLRVTNNGDDATTAITSNTGMTPVLNPLPRSLSLDGRLSSESTLVGQQNTARHVWVSPTNSLTVNTNTRLVGTNFDGTNKDTNFWSETVTGSGAVTQAGKVTLSTGTTANSTTQYESVRKARFVVGSANQFVGAFKFVTINETNNVRRCGAYTDDNGGFFQLDGSTFSLGFRTAGADTFITSGNFNGNYGPKFEIVANTPYKFEAEWTPVGGQYYVNGILLHSVSPSNPPQTLTWPIRIENFNYDGGTSDVDFECYGAVITRQGQLETNGTYKYISGAATTVLKYGAGALHAIVNNDNAGTITLYDNIAASGNVIASIDLIKVLGSLSFKAPFSDGLTVVTTGTAKVTIVYE